MLVAKTNPPRLEGAHGNNENVFGGMGLEAAIAAVAHSVTQRARARRDIFAWTLWAGRVLVEVIKPQIEHGGFTEWLNDNAVKLGYSGNIKDAVRRAQYDMRIYRRFKPHIARLVEAGVISTSAGMEEFDYVDNLAESSVNVAVSVLHELTRKNVPDAAIDFLVDLLINGIEVKHSDVSRIVDCAGTILELPTSEEPELFNDALDLFVAGVSDPQVYKALPDLRRSASFAGVVEELKNSGALSVPHEEEPILANKINITDLKYALNYEETEATLRHLYRNAPLTAVNPQQLSFVGTIEQLQALLNEHCARGEVYKITLTKTK